MILPCLVITRYYISNT